MDRLTWRGARLGSFCVALIALALGLFGCGRGDEDAAAAPPPLATVLARERAAARFERFDFATARRELSPLANAPDAAGSDLLRAAAIEFALHEPARAGELLDAAAERGERAPLLDYLRGEIAYERGDLEAAARHLAAAVEAAPDDLAAKLALASALEDRGRSAEAEALYRALVETGIENGGTWYIAALQRLPRLLRGAGREADAAPFAARWSELAAAGVRAPGEAVLRLGSLATLFASDPRGNVTSPMANELAFEALELGLPEAAGALELIACDLDGDLRMDALARRADGVVALLHGERGWSAKSVHAGETTLARACDLDGDGDLDVVVCGGDGEVAFLLRGEASWEPAPIPHPALPAAPTDALAVDFDHEGDLDLLLVGPFGARLWRNDGAGVAGGSFADASAEATLPSARAFAWCVSEDFDGDDDVDFLLGGAESVYLADNLRAGRFGDRSASMGEGARARVAPIAADFDGDARPDLWMRGGAQWWKQARERSFRRQDVPHESPLACAAIDLDLDGALDLAWRGHALLAAGLPQQRLATVAGWPAAEASAFCLADFDDDLAPDALLAQGTGVVLLRGRGARGNAMRVRLVGSKDNARAVGAVIEARAGEIYRRLYYRGEPEILGVGPHDKIDVFRVRWPNGLVQTQLERDLADQTGDFSLDEALGDFAQEQGLVGSCPFLYAWDGTRLGFVTDVLGITPLGLPMAPGMLVPFDHDEYVLVRSSQLVPRDGRLELAITEELREVTYLDRVRLDVVDHPAGTEVFPNERFCFPPFPEPHVHTLRAPVAPLRATASDGGDWTAALAAEDGVHALPFEREAPRFYGLAKPWYLELEFDRETIARAEKLRLVMTGWFNWTDASVNVAAARDPAVEFVPPILSVPNAEGGWRELGPPVGFPAGKTKTMVIELAPADLAADPRLRIACTLQLFWDRIALAIDGDDAELRIASLEPAAANLTLRGFSARIDDDREDAPERFEWERLASEPRWDQHPGSYTRLGDCVELLTAIDDRYAILGAGDALAISFDARSLPPLAAGFERDYLLFLDGWAKDRDPNTLAALEVEPLPFHGMSTYPYPASERFPAGELHERWRREWNTRPHHRWIEPVSPALAAERESGLRLLAGEHGE